MAAQSEINQFSKEAGVRLASINQGHIDLNKLKNFLSRLTLLNNPTTRQLKKMEDRARVERSIK